ncbi:MAG: PAS domain S-box protein, partial [Promethearchaeota archaeon]
MIKSEQKFKILFKNLFIPSFIWQKVNDDFFLIDFNIAAEELTEGKIKKLLKIKASKLFKENPDIFNDLNRCVNDKINFSRELDYVLKTTGETKSFQVKYSYIPPDLVVLYAEDITMQKKNHYQLKESEKKLKELNKEVEQRIIERTKELKESEEKYRTLVNNISDVIVEIDSAGKPIYINPQNFDIFGHKPEDLIGQSPFGLIHPEDVDKVRAEMEKLINKEEAISVEYKALHRNGNYLTVSAKAGMFEREGKKRFVAVVRDITERKKTEEKLKRSEEKYKSLFESSIQGIIVSNHEEILISVNPAAAAILSYNCPEELLGLPVIELYGDPTQRERIVQKMLRTGYLKDFETQLKKKDNKPIDISFSGTLHKDKEGNILRIEMLFNDITERKKAEEKLKESEKKYKNLANELEMILDHIPGIVLYKDTENNILRANKFLTDAHNLTKEEMEGLSCFDIYPKEQAQAYWDDDIEVIRSKKPKLNIIEPWEVGQDKKWVNMSKIPFIDEHGKVKGIIAMGTDITVAKLAEEKIKESEEKYRALFETSTDGIGFIGLNGKFEEV